MKLVVPYSVNSKEYTLASELGFAAGISLVVSAGTLCTTAVDSEYWREEADLSIAMAQERAVRLLR